MHTQVLGWTEARLYAGMRMRTGLAGNLVHFHASLAITYELKHHYGQRHKEWQTQDHGRKPHYRVVAWKRFPTALRRTWREKARKQRKALWMERGHGRKGLEVSGNRAKSQRNIKGDKMQQLGRLPCGWRWDKWFQATNKTTHILRRILRHAPRGGPARRHSRRLPTFSPSKPTKVAVRDCFFSFF